MLKRLTFYSILFSTPILLSVELTGGFYHCDKDEFYCPQGIELYKFGDTITGLKVTYLGDCEGQGSVEFGCGVDSCYGGGFSGAYQKIVPITSSSYLWQHQAYQFECIFKK